VKLKLIGQPCVIWWGIIGWMLDVTRSKKVPRSNISIASKH